MKSDTVITTHPAKSAELFPAGFARETLRVCKHSNENKVPHFYGLRAATRPGRTWGLKGARPPSPVSRHNFRVPLLCPHSQARAGIRYTPPLSVASQCLQIPPPLPPPQTLRRPRRPTKGKAFLAPPGSLLVKCKAARLHNRIKYATNGFAKRWRRGYYRPTHADRHAPALPNRHALQDKIAHLGGQSRPRKVRFVVFIYLLCMPIWQNDCHFVGVVSVLEKKDYIYRNNPLKRFKMALVKFTAVVDAMSGKLNGTVFAKNKGGAYVRSRGQVSNPQTLAQQAVRAAFGAISRMWSALTGAQREAWNAAADGRTYTNRLGDIKKLTGKAYFQQVNQNLQVVGKDPINSPRPSAPISYINVVNDPLSADSNEDGELQDVDFEFQYVVDRDYPDNTLFVLEATPQLNPGIDNANTAFRNIAVSKETRATPQLLVPADFATGSKTLVQALTERFGEYLPGSKIQMRIRGINPVTGEASVAYKAQAIVGLDT